MDVSIAALPKVPGGGPREGKPEVPRDLLGTDQLVALYRSLWAIRDRDGPTRKYRRELWCNLRDRIDNGLGMPFDWSTSGDTYKRRNRLWKELHEASGVRGKWVGYFGL